MPSPAPEPVTVRKNEIVRAGAGAGKTYALTHKVMDLASEQLRQTGKLPRLIVTTFTRKATQELRERLMLLALEERPELVDFVNSRSHLVVSTIHGVMDLYLKRFGASLCIDPSYRVIGSAEAGKLARQTLRQILLSDEASADLLETFPFNRLCGLVRQIDTVLAERPEAKPFDLEDFERLSHEARNEVAEKLHEAATRIREETEKDGWVKMADAYLSLASALTTGGWSKQGRDRFQSQLSTMKSAQHRKASPAVSDETAEFAKLARKPLKDFLSSLHDPDAWILFNGRYLLIDEIARKFSTAFRKVKLEQGFLEISDLEHRAMDCIRANPESVVAFWQEWDHWLIDEYQDTSPFQVELLAKLSGERPSFIVGDPQQSIYLFRGARSEVFGQREKQILKAGGEQKLLSVNRRSRPELLIFLNDFFTRLDPPFQPMEPFIREGDAIDPQRLVATVFIGQKPGAPAEGQVETPEQTESSSESSSDASTESSADESEDAVSKCEQEMRAVVCHVQELIRNGARPEDICILGRTNGTLSEVASWLNKYRLPTHVHAAAGFFDRREIRDALALLKFLINPHDDTNLIELLRSPWFRIPDRALAPVTRAKKRGDVTSLWERLVEERSMSDELRVVARLQDLLQISMTDGISEAFRRSLISAGFIDLSHRHDVSGRRESNLWKLLSRLQREEVKPGFNPLSFVAGSVSALRLEEGNAEGDAVAAVEPDRINLMTVHASKGLEFKHVILPRMDQKPRVTTSEEFTFDERVGRWALRVPYGDDGEMTKSLPEVAWLTRFRTHELDEHARVLYVALTRASVSVFLSWTEPIQTHSWASQVGMDLADGSHAMPSYTYFVNREDPQPSDAALTTEAAVQPRAPWRGLTVDAAKSERALSVTQVLDQKPGVGFSSENQIDVARLLKSASRGTAVHRLMELMKYPMSAEMRARILTKWFPGQEADVVKAVEFVQATTAPPIGEIIRNGEVEWGFNVIEDGFLIPGQIDLWGRTDAGEAWIVDYKTGTPDYREKAFDQLQIYAFALRKSGLFSENESLQLAAVYPFSEQIYIQPEPPMERVRKMLGLKV